MEFERLLSGLVRYINGVIMPTMNDVQKMVVRLFLSRILRSGKEIKTALSNNSFIKTFGFMSEDGRVDAEGLLEDLKRVFAENPTLEVQIPMYGVMRFNAEDVDVIRRYVMEG